MASQIYEESGLSVVSFARPGGPFLQFDVASGAVLDKDDARKLVAALESFIGGAAAARCKNCGARCDE